MPAWAFGVVAALVIMAVGLAVIWALVSIAGRGGEPSCDGEVDLGYAPELIQAARVEPFFQAVDDRCQFWLAVDEAGDVVAYKKQLPGRSCNVRWDIELQSWRCGDLAIDPADLQRWPARVEIRDGLEHLLIDFGPAPDAS